MHSPVTNRRKETARRPFAAPASLPCGLAIAAFLAAGFVATPVAHSQTADDTIILPQEIADPLEPVNRLIWGANKGFTNRVLRPLGNGYQAVVGEKAREKISNFGRNLNYPVRVVNKVLQGRHQEAREETSRFLTNTTVGILGFYDPASKRKNIPKSEADTGQTLGKAGWTPQTYLMLPGYGPSNERDTVGLIGDAALKPLNYFPPYGTIHTGVTFNNYSGQVDEFRRLTKTNSDSYAFLKQTWGYVRGNAVNGYEVTKPDGGLPVETLQAIFFRVHDPDFPKKSRTTSARMATGKKLQFTYWLQPGMAPIVYIVPGLGAHRLDRSSMALAELVYDRGFSAVTLSSGFHPEFVKAASSTSLPAYPPIDTRDLHLALTAIDHRLEDLYPGHTHSRALLGYSMGGFHTLMIAANAVEQGQDSSLVQFDRFVGINTPVNLVYGMSMLDEYFNAALEWDAADRTERIDNTFRKVAALVRQESAVTAAANGAQLPFNTVESKFLIGYAYRTVLRDIIFTSQRRENQGVLTEPVKPLRRTAAYREIYGYSYADYLEEFVIPYYRSRNIDLTDGNALENAMNLRAHTSGLRNNSRIHLVMTRNDFLLAPGDLAWVESIFPPNRLNLFESGGHMGNLKEERVQKATVDHLSDMLP